MATELGRLVDTVGNALLQIRDMFADPSDLLFHEIHADMERLEAFFNSKALIDASFAYVCERDEAGRLSGAKYPNAYLKEHLGLSPREAFDRLARGRDLFAEPEIPDTEPETGSNTEAEQVEDLFGFAAEESDEERQEREAEEARRRAREREEAKERARAEQEEARKHAEKVSAAKQEAIRQELDKLLDAAKGERPRLLAAALAEADKRDVKDLRATVRRWVDAENRKHRQPDNPNAGMEKRSIHVGNVGADDLVDIHIKATRGGAALFKALTDKGLVANSNLPEGVEDYRTPGQRRYDQLMAMLQHFDNCEKPRNGGAASVVVTVTPDDIADADATTLFSTNTGIDVDAFDITRLGTDGAAEFVLTVDGATSVPLNLYRTRRTASIGQRIAMLAVQGVCSWAGCSTPLTECEAHHILAWVKGGDTNIENLTGLCREHHRRNNDHCDNAFNTSHMEYDPESHRAGLRRPNGDLVFNGTDGAESSAVGKLRKRGQHRAAPPAGPPSAAPPGTPHAREPERAPVPAAPPPPPRGAVRLPKEFPLGPDGPPF
ncbi:HNH endonuclease [Corynebacterium sp. TA-R-1]|uniref:HNH endonuclease n=1 Tax=Corynebacterium stercoris TaxID=2943490 RepID=A0ABT1G044_9CORY|nr:HNH endonuclease signature motif containing protein [Corynebacterium stercoris]MCP1387050.1 HNH endonuclease [Corynebacterium stercoris]